MYAVSQAVDSDELVRMALDALRERICVLDRAGTIVLTNQAWRQSVRENDASLIGCAVGVNFLNACRSAAGSLAERAIEAATGIETVLRGAAPEFSLDYLSRSFYRKAWFQLRARPLRRGGGGAIILHSEITRQVLLAEKFRRTKRQCDLLLENPVDVATVLDANGQIRYQSPLSEGVLGNRPEELVGRPIIDFVHPDDADRVRRLLRDCLRYPHLKHPCEYRFRKRNGSWRSLESIGRKLRSHPEGEIILNSRDITARKLAEKNSREKEASLARHCGDLEALAARLFREREEERRRVAAELNSHLGQRLASMSLQAAQIGAHPAAPADSYSLQTCLAGLHRELDHLGRALYPPLLDHFGLAVALRDYCVEFTRKEGIPVTYIHRGISTSLPAHTAAALYRVAEEALAIVSKHVRPQRVWVTLSRAATGIRLAIRDDGTSFDPVMVGPVWDLSIVALRERLRDVKGSLIVRSRRSGEREIVALAPLR